MTHPTRTQGEIVAGLLGPAGAELTCDECFDLLDVYVDTELSGEDADARVPGMREHLTGCPACGEEHTSLTDLLRLGAAWTGARRPSHPRGISQPDGR